MTEPVEFFNPLEQEVTDKSLRRAYEMSRVRSVIDSYHGRLDALAEAIQNAVDAIEERWGDWTSTAGDHEEPGRDDRPRIRVLIDFDSNTVGVLDNGVGIPPEKLPSVLEPFVSPKRLSAHSYRGHKGVGTTFLAYGHPRFEIHTRVGGEDPVAYAIEGGRAWATSEEIDDPPAYQLLQTHFAGLDHHESGTYVEIKFDSTTTLKDVSRLLHNTPKMWAEVLRSNTALGQVALAAESAPDWSEHLESSLRHPDETTRVEFRFPFPHLSLPASEARELQWLQNNPQSKREYELVYAEKSHDQLKALLKSDLDELEASDDPDERQIADTFKRYEVGAYASLAYKNTFYEDLFRKQISRPNAKNYSLSPGVGGGILVASVGMPMGGLQSHLMETMQPQERRRYFLLLHFNSRYSPDIGRKTIPQDIEPLVEFLEERMLKLLRTQATRLLRDREIGRRKKGAGSLAAEQELKSFTDEVKDLERQDHELDMHDILLGRTPRWEEEVLAIFVDLVVTGRLPGYQIRGLPGTTGRYDMLFDYSVPPSLGEQEQEPLGVSDYQIGEDGLSLTDLWGEFKVDINSLISDLESEDGDPSKKYFNQVKLVVAWSVSSITSDKYTVTPYDDTSWKNRVFYGATHYLEATGNDHTVEIIELRTYIDEGLGREAAM